MIKTFTYDDVIRYIYSETTEDENQRIQNAMIADENLMSFYLDTIAICQELLKIERNPSSSTISNILAYSRIQSSEMIASPN